MGEILRENRVVAGAGVEVSGAEMSREDGGSHGIATEY